MKIAEKLLRPASQSPEIAVESALLFVSLAATDRAFLPVALPWGAQLAVLALGAFLLGRAGPPAGPGWRRAAARLPEILIVGVASAALFCYWLNLPWAALSFLPIWLVLELAYQVGWKEHFPRLRDTWRSRQAHRDDIRLGEALLVAAVACLAGAFYPAFWSLPPSRAHAVVLGWTVILLAAYRAALRLSVRAEDPRSENCRWIVLGAAGLFLLQGLARADRHGGGDSQWYGTMLGDMVAQIRAGVFPVWTGQSEYQFNGAIYPLRVAPAIHYMGGLLDTLTWHTLGVFALQNLLLTLIGIAALAFTYLSLRALLPQRRWLAAGLAVLFLACPGVLGIVYNSDLFMSWTTLPWVPLVWFATVRSFRDGGSWRTMVLLGASLGLCWWGHSPIALWMTLLAGFAQFARFLRQRPVGLGWMQAAAGGLAFAAIAAYPIGSVLFYPPEPAVDATAFQRATPQAIVQFLGAAFPGIVLPLSDLGRLLGDYQLGYSLWAILLFCLWHFRELRRPEARILIGIAAVLLLLLAPIPGVDLALWRLVPSFIRNVTSNWAMNRLYLPLAGATVYGLAAAASGEFLRAPARQRALTLLVGIGCAWSLVEASKFAKGSRINGRALGEGMSQMRAENAMATRFAYLIFPRIPAYFSDGVVDAQLENRLWSAGTGRLLAANLASARAAAVPLGEEEFSAVPKPDDYLQTSAAFRLEPGRRYLLGLDVLDPARARGVLQIKGTTFFREYALPDYGGAESFGIGGRHSGLIPVWTSIPSGDDVWVRFFPYGTAGPAESLQPFARVTWMDYDPARLPVRISSWIPYRARVVSPEAAWLETPRMYQRAYRATANGQETPVRKSSEGLVEVRVPAGTSEVTLAYRAPAGLSALFWISLGSIALVWGALGVGAVRRTMA